MSSNFLDTPLPKGGGLRCFIGTAYAVCAGTFEISFSFSGHFILVCLNSKHAPVESLYWILFTLSGLGYTKILRLSGLVKYTNKTPMAKLTINIGMRIYLRILIMRWYYIIGLQYCLVIWFSCQICLFWRIMRLTRPRTKVRMALKALTKAHLLTQMMAVLIRTFPEPRCQS